MNSETHYIIFSAYYKYGKTRTEIIVGEKKFRKYAIEHYWENNLNARVCTRYDFEQFLLHHDATYFDEKDRSVFEKILSEYKTDPNKYSEESYSWIVERPSKVDKNFRVHFIMNGHVFRYSEERAQYYSKFETMETSEITKLMVECGRQAIYGEEGWGWINIVTITGSDFKVKSEYGGYSG
uniref:Uncharacterized protein n=1 Tax=Pithovirus LCPAC403 TaxID=2506596 RepID=A0A481ZBA0_9VIRU|nr:MAG: uncharacterized protein LCPAC403_00500 [Pithovirus LCPAC403]